jgi:Protein of unknown function (DUF3098)
MAKQQPNRPAANTQAPAAAQQKAAPVRASAPKRDNIFTEGKDEFIFGRQHFMLFGVALALVLLGLAFMTGGQQPDPNQWDESIIYSPMRITVAPILMVSGFVVAIVGIFRKNAE